MSDNITNREDVFLGKIAGRDVDISTWTPPVANGVHEKILEEIADRIDSISESSLPEIEEGDEGKVLGVADGAYALVSGGGGGGGGALFSMTDDDYDSETGIFTSSTFTAQDVLDAYFSGSPVLIYFPETTYSGETILSLLSASKIMTGASGTPHFDFTTNSAISYTTVEEDNQHMQFSVYID